MAERAALPGWPRYLSREESARYLGVSTTTFEQEVRDGHWPQPRRRGAKFARLTWDRQLLDAYADQAAGAALRGAGLPAAAPARDTSADPAAAAVQADAEAAALRGVTNAAAQHRPQHRQPAPPRRRRRIHLVSPPHEAPDRP